MVRLQELGQCRRARLCHGPVRPPAHCAGEGPQQRCPNLSGKFPEEVQPLIDDLNNLVAAPGEQILRARVQAGNIAHGLKVQLQLPEFRR